MFCFTGCKVLHINIKLLEIMTKFLKKCAYFSVFTAKIIPNNHCLGCTQVLSMTNSFFFQDIFFQEVVLDINEF